jgi:hypothetical protein
MEKLKKLYNILKHIAGIRQTIFKKINLTY